MLSKNLVTISNSDNTKLQNLQTTINTPNTKRFDFHFNTSKNSNKAQTSILSQINYNNYKNSVAGKYYKYLSNCNGC